MGDRNAGHDGPGPGVTTREQARDWLRATDYRPTTVQVPVMKRLSARIGKLHWRNPEIIALAKLIGRMPSAVAMKAVNFASLDPAITSTGRSGLGNA